MSYGQGKQPCVRLSPSVTFAERFTVTRIESIRFHKMACNPFFCWYFPFCDTIYNSWLIWYPQDGNGRMCRSIASTPLVRTGCTPIDINLNVSHEFAPFSEMCFDSARSFPAYHAGLAAGLYSVDPAYAQRDVCCPRIHPNLPLIPKPDSRTPDPTPQCLARTRRATLEGVIFCNC